jgi:hypothetical protein
LRAGASPFFTSSSNNVLCSWLNFTLYLLTEVSLRDVFLIIHKDTSFSSRVPSLLLRVLLSLSSFSQKCAMKFDRAVGTRFIASADLSLFKHVK